MKLVTDSKCAVLNLVKIKYRKPETRINPHLICLSRLEQISVELTDAEWVRIVVPVIATYFVRKLV